MKQTVKTSRVAGQLEKMFRLLNNHFFDGALPEVVISLKKTVGAYGHFTCGNEQLFRLQGRERNGGIPGNGGQGRRHSGKAEIPGGPHVP